jgi:hypothetical protein
MVCTHASEYVKIGAGNKHLRCACCRVKTVILLMTRQTEPTPLTHDTMYMPMLNLMLHLVYLLDVDMSLLADALPTPQGSKVPTYTHGLTQVLLPYKRTYAVPPTPHILWAVHNGPLSSKQPKKWKSCLHQYKPAAYQMQHPLPTLPTQCTSQQWSQDPTLQLPVPVLALDHIPVGTHNCHPRHSSVGTMQLFAPN